MGRPGTSPHTVEACLGILYNQILRQLSSFKFQALKLMYEQIYTLKFLNLLNMFSSILTIILSSKALSYV